MTNFYGSQPQPPVGKKPKPLVIIALIIFGVAALLCCAGALMSAIPGDDSDARGLSVVEPSPTAARDASPAAAAKASPSPMPAPKVKAPPVAIEADAVVHVGEDVPAGTYRVTTGVGGFCYWKKSSDSEGQNIIANDIVTGGRPQVTLKKGQWFTSSRCGEWHKR